MRAAAPLPPPLAHPLHVLPDLHALLRGEHAHDLLVQLLPRLPVRRAGGRVSLAELLHDVPDLRFLPSAQIHAAHHVRHESVTMPLSVALPCRAENAAGRRLRRLLREDRCGGSQCGAQSRGKK